MILNRLFCGGANKTLPGFTYTGNYTVIDGGDSGWRIKFLTSGTLTLHSKRNIDVFCVGGGASGSYGLKSPASSTVNTIGTGVGGGGGYTKTSKNIQALAGKSYAITIGAGGAPVGGGATIANGRAGGSTSAFGVTAAGGAPVTKSGGNQDYYAGNGGSGGGGSGNLDRPYSGCKGGSDGGNGYGHILSNGSYTATETIIPTNQDWGQGQQSSTREFGEAGGTLYSGGGGGAGCRKTISGTTYTSTPGAGGSGGGGKGAGYNSNAVAGTANTGGGGGGGCYSETPSYRHASGAGGSGIVVIRNHI